MKIKKYFDALWINTNFVEKNSISDDYRKGPKMHHRQAPVEKNLKIGQDLAKLQ